MGKRKITLKEEIREVEEFPRVAVSVLGLEPPIQRTELDTMMVVVPIEEGFEVHALGQHEDMVRMGVAVVDFFAKIGLLGEVMMNHTLHNQLHPNSGHIAQEVTFARVGEGAEEVDPDEVEEAFRAALRGLRVSRGDSGEQH